MSDELRSGPSGKEGPEPLLRIVDLSRHFRVGGMFSKQMLHAVDDFSLTVGR